MKLISANYPFLELIIDIFEIIAWTEAARAPLKCVKIKRDRYDEPEMIYYDRHENNITISRKCIFLISRKYNAYDEQKI